MKINELLSVVTSEKRGWLVSVFVAALFFILVFFLWPRWRAIIELDPDEGYNAMKALLLEQGYEFGTQIWSDHPPFYSYLLWFAFKAFGFDIAYARTLNLFFVSALLFALYDILRRQYGHMAAVAGVLLLLSTYRFARYSVAVMIGFPSLSLAMLSVWALTVWQQSYKARFLALSGAFLGVSLSIKLFTAVLLPIGAFCIAFAWPGRSKPGLEIKRLLFHPAMWLVAAILVFALCSLPAICNGSLFSLSSSHAKAFLRDHSEGKRLLFFLSMHFPFWAAALAGAVAARTDRQITCLLFSLWSIVALLILYFNYPVWYHHIFLLNLPAAGLGGIFFHHFRQYLGKRGQPDKRAWAITVALLVGILAASFSLHIARSGEIVSFGRSAGKERSNREALELIKKYRGPDRTMITSCQILAFESSSRIPPGLSVTSRKRFRTGLLKASDVVQEIRAWNAEQVVMDDRWTRDVRDEVEEAITKKYKRVFYDKENDKLQIFVRRDLLDRP